MFTYGRFRPEADVRIIRLVGRQARRSTYLTKDGNVEKDENSNSDEDEGLWK